MNPSLLDCAVEVQLSHMKYINFVYGILTGLILSIAFIGVGLTLLTTLSM